MADILDIVDRPRQEKKKIRRLDLSLRLQIEMGEWAATRAGRVEII